MFTFGIGIGIAVCLGTQAIFKEMNRLRKENKKLRIENDALTGRGPKEYYHTKRHYASYEEYDPDIERENERLEKELED